MPGHQNSRYALMLGAALILTAPLSAEGNAYQAPAELRLQLIHPTQAERDQEVRLLGEGGRYSGELPALPGRMYLQLSDLEGEWRLLGEIAPGKRQVRLAPAPMPQARP